MKKICIVTGSRSEYGLLRTTLFKIQESKKFKIQIIATGMHLSAEYGMTVQEILDDGFIVDKRVETILSSDTAVGVVKSVGLGVISFAETLDELRPDLIMVLGDRYEILPAVVAALFLKVPIAHIHGGESTLGSIDDSIRHSISKMSHLHFVAAEEYRNKLIAMGESKSRIHVVGGLGLDAIYEEELIQKKDLEKIYKIKFADKNLLITYHPSTLEDEEYPGKNFLQLLMALKQFKGINFYFTSPNADEGSRKLIEMLDDFQRKNKNVYVFKSIGHKAYLSFIQYVDGVVGNSSSGLIEVPSFKKGTVNIGKRQFGRLEASSVINCNPNCDEIYDAILNLYKPTFLKKLKNTINPYGAGGAGVKIVNTLINTDFSKLLSKN